MHSADPRITEAERFAVARLPAATTVEEMAQHLWAVVENILRGSLPSSSRAQPISYVTHIRVREAQRLLRRRESSVAEICPSDAVQYFS